MDTRTEAPGPEFAVVLGRRTIQQTRAKLRQVVYGASAYTALAIFAALTFTFFGPLNLFYLAFVRLMLVAGVSALVAILAHFTYRILEHLSEELNELSGRVPDIRKKDREP